ncbi:hypothetical protein PGT21_036933 [Puccinia graminis f. sp. tritici]|uniref:Uncharacterized protein n=1 Tax=Puccinia graminis f. sp. tritici TaxID=56615 RepID=A0A5B0QDX9_PUCGR|nr:hypothetical protein PGT21_036933 [Puccinia graminis f. sp. tritici]
MSGKLSSSVDPNVDSNDTSSLKVSGIVQLKSQGSESNYLDWSFVVLLHLQLLNLAYVLNTVAVEDRTAAYLRDSVAVSSFIARTMW